MACLKFIKCVAREHNILRRTYEATERVLLVICFANFDHHFEYKGGDVPHLQKRMKDHKNPAAEHFIKHSQILY